jgi:signal transduction histidine kinase
MSNLIENAVRYTPEGGSVTAVVEKYASGCAFIVEDNGPGIAVEEREKVFERFYRGSEFGSSGSGLGLSIVQEIAHLHGAQATIGDGPSNSGTAVKVAFPVLCARIDSAGGNQ